jgi:hypothetical protein
VPEKDMKEMIPHWVRKLVLFSRHNENDKVKMDDIGRACRTYGEEEGWIWDFDGKARRKEAGKKTQT